MGVSLFATSSAQSREQARSHTRSILATGVDRDIDAHPLPGPAQRASQLFPGLVPDFREIYFSAGRDPGRPDRSKRVAGLINGPAVHPHPRPIMKNKFLHSTILLASGLALVAFAACSPEKRETLADKSKDAYQDTKAAVAQGWDNVKDFTFEKRSDFSAQLKARQTGFEADVSKLRADYSEAQASASRKAAMQELKDSEADYHQKLAALGDATADTWTAGRDNVVAAWDRLQASYAKARAGN